MNRFSLPICPQIPNNPVKEKAHLIVMVFVLYLGWCIWYLVNLTINASDRLLSTITFGLAMHPGLVDSQTMSAPAIEMFESWNTCGDSVHVLT